MELNTCRSQVLTIDRAGNSMRHQLPNPLLSDRANLVQTGFLKHLFVVQWGCETVRDRGYAVLYYSTGGGNAEGSENIEFYDATGSQVDETSKDWKELNRHWDASLKPVKSIMPLEGAK